MQGLDGELRRTTLELRPGAERARPPPRRPIASSLAPNEAMPIFFSVGCGAPRAADAGSVPARLARGAPRSARRPQGATTVETSNDLFNEVLCRSMADLCMLMTNTPQGRYPYAGIPWYSTTFGRDGLITALQMLWFDPGVARGVLRRLAAFQATDDDPGLGRAAGQDPARDARRRDGGAARGAVRPLLRQRRCDAAVRHARRPLCRAHRRRRDDRGAVAQHRGRARLDRRPRRSPTATASSNTTARPSRAWPTRAGRIRYDAIFHADGRLAEGPIALAEVQGYVYCAKQHGGALRRAPGATASRRASSRREADALARAVRRELLVPGDRHLRAGARRRQAALPRAQLQCRPGAVHRHRQARARGRGRRPAAAAAILLRLGHPHHRQQRGALQSDVLSQRLGLAARQRADRARARPLRPQARGRAAVQGPVRRRHLHGDAAAARAVLRLPARARARPDALSGRLLAAGLGERHAVHAARGLARAAIRSDANEIRLRNPRLPAFLDEVVLRNLRLKAGQRRLEGEPPRHRGVGGDLRRRGQVQVSVVFP